MAIEHNEVQTQNKDISQDRVRWLVGGMLPLVGVALIEAERQADAALVAEDIAGAVAGGALEWGQCWAVAGPAFVYDSAGNGEAADPAPYFGGELPPVPPLMLDRPADFAHEVQSSGGARLLVVPVGETHPQAFAYVVQLRAIAEQLNCCVLIVAGDDTPDRGLVEELRFCARSVLRVQRDGDAGAIEQAKGATAGGRQHWTFAVRHFDVDGQPVEAIDDVMLYPPLPAKVSATPQNETLH